MAYPQKIIDDLGRTLILKEKPKRIISLVPSLSELLVDLGLKNKLVGITRFCVHPKSLAKEKTSVGGTKKVNYTKIKALKPDFILCNKEENTQEMVLKLAQIAPVFVSDINTIEDTLNLIHNLGNIFECNEKATYIIDIIQNKQKDFQVTVRAKKPLKTAYFIWKKPWMLAGENTFINSLLALNKFNNQFLSKGHYPEIKLEELKDLDLMLLSSEPYPFKQKDIEELQAYTDAKIILVDGEYFSWYGSRLIKAFDYFKKLSLNS
jgi:ABC-type Fe3+-hydroxamate transport system substrate-binding protein